MTLFKSILVYCATSHSYMCVACLHLLSMFYYGKKHLADELLQAHWLVCGDFNMVDAQEDKKRPLLVKMPHGEKPT
jgi:hypothetical protein